MSEEVARSKCGSGSFKQICFGLLIGSMSLLKVCVSCRAGQGKDGSLSSVKHVCLNGCEKRGYTRVYDHWSCVGLNFLEL